MTERMKDAFVVRDQNGIQNMIPSQRERPMAMGDGTFMADNAFVPMMSYTPEELGINMAAYPSAPAQEQTAFEIAMQDNSQSGDMKSMTPVQEAVLQSSNNPYLSVVQQDEVDGGVQFNSDWVENNAFGILKTVVILGLGAWIGKTYL